MSVTSDVTARCAAWQRAEGVGLPVYRFIVWVGQQWTQFHNEQGHAGRRDGCSACASAARTDGAFDEWLVSERRAA